MGLTIQNAHIRIGQRVILDVPHITFPARQTSVIIGANGAGKSTLLKHILERGAQATWQGQPIQAALKQKQLAWVGQHESFQLPMSVLEYVLMGKLARLAWYQHPGEADRQDATQWLEQFDLAHLAHKRLETLSGGEKQRAAIVRALMQNARLLLLDEPTNHLDIRHCHQLMHQLRRLPQQPTIVMVLHDLNLAAHYSDFAVLMKQGSIFAQGTTQSVMQPEYLTTLYDWPIIQQADGSFQAAHQNLIENSIGK